MMCSSTTMSAMAVYVVVVVEVGRRPPRAPHTPRDLWCAP